MLTSRILSVLAKKKKTQMESNMLGFAYKNEDGTVINGYVIEVCMKQRFIMGTKKYIVQGKK